jgi:argininosuccinate lyase
MAGMVDTLAVDRERMRAAATEGYTTATAVADALVRRGLPFRSAHHAVGALVEQAEEAGLPLHRVTDADVALALTSSGDPLAATLAGDPTLGEALRSAAGLDGAVATCDVVGGTAPRRVATALRAARERLDRELIAADREAG